VAGEVRRIASRRGWRNLTVFDSPGFALFALAVIVFVGWYAVGTQYNVRRGNNALKWIQKGLPLMGERATLRWLGSSVVELKITKAKDPFRSSELLVVLEPRDVPVLWWWGHARGRHDLVIVRGQLRAAPHFDLEARGQKVWGQSDLKRDVSPKWIAVQGGVANSMSADYRGEISPFSINRLIVSASMDGVTVTRLAIRRAVPNLELNFILPKFDQVSSQRVFSSLRELSEEVLKL
jgi:hypothetical protein